MSRDICSCLCPGTMGHRDKKFFLSRDVPWKPYYCVVRTFDGEMKIKHMYFAQVLALRRVLSQYLNKNAMRRVTNSACRSWKKARATTAGVSMFFYCVNYGSMGCQASKRGITKLDRNSVKSQYAKILFTDHCRWQNFCPSLLRLVDSLQSSS